MRAAITLAVLDPFDPDLYGRTTKNFTIARGFAEVATESDFIAAAEDENYQKITFTANITLRSALTMSDDLLLDLDAYELSFLSEGNLTYGRNCRLILAAGDEARFIKYAYAADEITLTADIGVDAKTELTFTDYTLPNVTGANCLSTVVHMNGYSFLGGLSIVNSHIENFSFTFENSSEEVSTIGSAVGGYAFNYGTCYEETYVTFRNLTVYGVYHQGGSGTAQVVDLSAENCTFLAARDVNNAYAFKIWTSMTASGTYTNCVFDGANAFYVNRGYEYDHDNSRTLPAYFFNNCTLRAYGECVKVSNVEEYYGNALMMERNKSNLYVQINNSYLYSQNGNCIRIPNRTGVYLDCDSGTTFVHPAGKLNVN